MPAQPSIYDILGWQRSWDDPTSGTTGQKSMADYLYGLMEQAGQFDEDIGFTATETTGIDRNVQQGTWDWETKGRGGDVSAPDIFSSLFGQETPFQDMSKEDLEALFTGELVNPEWYKPEETFQDPNSMYETAKWTGGKWDEKGINDMVSSLLGLQEGLGRVGDITKRFDLEGQLAGEEREAGRDIKTAYESYIPREIVSRYGALQGGGASPAGEASEAEYLSSVSSAQRRKGRNVRSIYGELEDEIFGGLGKWMGNITS